MGDDQLIERSPFVQLQPLQGKGPCRLFEHSENPSSQEGEILQMTIEKAHALQGRTL